MVSCNASSNCNVSSQRLRDHNDGFFYLWVAFQYSIAVSGTLMNSLVLLSFYRFKKLRSPSNILFFGLSVVSFILDCVVLPMGTTTTLLRRYIKVPGEWCRYLNYTHQSLSWISTSTICAISVNRFIAVIFPYFYKSMTAQKTFMFFGIPCFICPPFILLFWISGIAGKFVPALGVGLCITVTKSAYSLLYQGIFLFAPTALMVFCYAGMLLKLISVQRFRPIYPSPGSLHVLELVERVKQRRTAQSALSIFLCFLAFCLTYFPEHIYNSGLRLHHLDTSSPMLQIWLRSLYNLGTVANPVRQSPYPTSTY